MPRAFGSLWPDVNGIWIALLESNRVEESKLGVLQQAKTEHKIAIRIRQTFLGFEVTAVGENFISNSTSFNVAKSDSRFVFTYSYVQNNRNLNYGDLASFEGLGRLVFDSQAQFSSGNFFTNRGASPLGGTAGTFLKCKRVRLDSGLGDEDLVQVLAEDNNP